VPDGGVGPRALAMFVTPHGFGHAARACAVAEALVARRPSLRLEIFTQVPRWFFVESLGASFGYHERAVDVALAQRSALEEDLDESAERLERFLPFAEGLVRSLAEEVRGSGCAAVLCDIAPLGIAVAEAARVPSVLVANFTWSWVYRHYGEDHPTFLAAADYLERWERRATVRINTSPVCDPSAPGVTVSPLSRRPLRPREEIRRALHLGGEERMVLVTMGGISWNYRRLEALSALERASVVVPGGSAEPRRERNLVLLPHRCGFYHPDLVHAADAVIGKLGYSTVAEVCRAGAPLGYVTRPSFPESPVLERFVRQHLASRAIPPEAFAAMAWVGAVPELLVDRPALADCGDGGDQVAVLVDELVTEAG
jgi:UDP:flavonoid glycosyltransferase YjiC (YdhE family)